MVSVAVKQPTNAGCFHSSKKINANYRQYEFNFVRDPSHSRDITHRSSPYSPEAVFSAKARINPQLGRRGRGKKNEREKKKESLRLKTRLSTRPVMAARGGGGKAHVVDDGDDYDGPAAPPNGYVLP